MRVRLMLLLTIFLVLVSAIPDPRRGKGSGGSGDSDDSEDSENSDNSGNSEDTPEPTSTEASPSSTTTSSTSETSTTRTTRTTSTRTSSTSTPQPSPSKAPKNDSDNDVDSPAGDFLMYRENKLLASLVQDKWNKTCDDPEVRTFDEHPDKSWTALGCNEMHRALVFEWWQYRNKTDLPYLEFVADKLGAKGWKCSAEKCHKPDLKCKDTKYTCGHLILNSIANIHAMYSDALHSVREARKNTTRENVGFAEFFELIEYDIVFRKAMLRPLKNIGLYVASLFAGQMNVVARFRAKRASSSLLEHGFASVAELSMPYTKFNLTNTLNGDTISENLKNILGRVFDQAIVMQEKTTKDLFSEKGRTALVSLSANGTFANLNVKIGIQMDFCLDIVRQMVISALIPQAWEFHRELWDKGDPANAVYFSKPFFINTGKSCGDETKPKQIKEWGNYNFEAICFDGKIWNIMVVKVSSRFDFGERDMITRAELIQPPKVRNLNIDNGFEYVRIENLFVSAYKGWEKGNHVQYWTPPKDASVVHTKENGVMELQYNDMESSAGLVQIQVCPNWEESMKSIRQTIFTNKKKRFDVERFKKNAWPCGA